VDTVYLYNGYSPSDDVGLRRLVAVIALLRKHLGHRQIAVETVAPSDLSAIDELYEAGLDVFVCNIEVHDAERFAEICPGKQVIGGQDAIYKALNYARSVFRSGAVVSHLIVGLEPLQSTIAGMKKLITQGIVPMLLPFRPLPGTALSDCPLASLDDVEQALLVQYELLESSGMPTHRLRDMGRVLTPMESGLLVGKEPYLPEQVATSSMGRRLSGWMDGLRRYLRSNGKIDANYQKGGQSLHWLLAKEGVPFLALAMLSLVGFMGGQLACTDRIDRSGMEFVADLPVLSGLVGQRADSSGCDIAAGPGIIAFGWCFARSGCLWHVRLSGCVLHSGGIYAGGGCQSHGFVGAFGFGAD